MTLVPLPQTLDVTLAEGVHKYIRSSKAKNTRKAYRSDLKHFAAFCRAMKLPARPASPATIAVYLTSMADAKPRFKAATMKRRLSSIAKAHSIKALDSPCSMRHAVVAEVWQGIKNLRGTAQTVKAPATVDHLKAMVAQMPESLTGQRDRALLLIGFAGALRRSELVALTVEDLDFVPEGLVLTIRASKTDQEGRGEKVAIMRGQTAETCPVRALREWLTAAEITTGALFRRVNRWGSLQGEGLSDQTVALTIKKYADAAGLDAELFSGHSLRAGLATSAALAGATERVIMKQTRHKSEAMVRRYIRDGNLFRQNVSGMIGL